MATRNPSVHATNPTKGHNVTQAQATKETAKKTPNGAKAEETAAAAPAQTAHEAETSEKKRGTIPTMPACIVYRQAGRVFAAIFNPLDGSSYVESGKGEGSAKGALEDSGFRLSSLTMDGPDWLAAKKPSDAELLGYATIKGFPLPKQGT